MITDHSPINYIPAFINFGANLSYRLKPINVNGAVERESSYWCLCRAGYELSWKLCELGMNVVGCARNVEKN